MGTLRFIGSFIWVCILGALMAGAIISALTAINTIGRMLEALNP